MSDDEHQTDLAKKNKAAAKLGRLGGKARMSKLTPNQRSMLAKLAVHARWAKAEEAKKPQEEK